MVPPGEVKVADLKLPRLPERQPVKLTISLAPDLHRALTTYAGLYKEAYGTEEAIADLVPAILATFLESDRALARAKRDTVP